MAIPEFQEVKNAEGQTIYFYSPTGEFTLAKDYTSPRFATEELAFVASTAKAPAKLAIVKPAKAEGV